MAGRFGAKNWPSEEPMFYLTPARLSYIMLHYTWLASVAVTYTVIFLLP